MFIESIAGFLSLLRAEQARTRLLFSFLENTALGFRVADGYRTIGEISWHIVDAVPGIMNRAGLEIPLWSQGRDGVENLRRGYETLSLAFRDQIEANWTDEHLKFEHDIYGERWTNGKTVMTLVLHEAHHRGQLTVLMRQVGLSLPDIYGPSKRAR